MDHILHELIQGSPEWHAFRLTHNGASEAAAMFGLSEYTTRSELLRQKSTGIAPEVDADKQALFDSGHASEATARPMAEAILGESLYPVTYSYGTLSASCDGLTMGGETAWEHKLHSTDLAAAVKRGELPEEYQPQCQQIMLVTGAEQVLFMVSDGTEANCVHMMVEPDTEWFERIQAGWAQFALDLEAYQPVEVLPAAVATPTMQLPALSIQVKGEISLIDNLAVFGEGLKAFIDRIPAKPSTDQEFVDCKEACKKLQEAQDALDAAEALALGQVATFDQMKRTKALYWDLARTTRLAVEKMVAAREQTIKAEIVQKAKAIYEEHVASLTKETGGPWICLAPPDFAGAIKGKRTIASIQNAVDTALANGKITADASAKRIRENLACIKADGAGYEFLFADSLALISKPIDDLRLLIKSRIADHAAAEAKRIEAEREKIRAEERAKAERELAEIESRRLKEERDQVQREFERNLIAQPTELPAAAPDIVTAPEHSAQPAPAAVPIKPVVALKASGKVIPSDESIILAVAMAFQVTPATALEWLCAMFAKQAA